MHTPDRPRQLTGKELLSRLPLNIDLRRVGLDPEKPFPAPRPSGQLLSAEEEIAHMRIRIERRLAGLPAEPPETQVGGIDLVRERLEDRIRLRCEGVSQEDIDIIAPLIALPYEDWTV